MLQGFKDFLFRGNIVDLAVAVVIGTAFTALVTAFTDAIITPLINSIGGEDAVKGLGFEIISGNDATRIDLALLINAIITFVIIAAVIYFFVVVPMKKIAERRAAGIEPEDETPSEDIALLREIRDALQTRGGQGL